MAVVLAVGCDAGNPPEPLIVAPADLTRAAVERDLGILVSTRLLEGAEVELVSRVRLLCWEVRLLPDRAAPSDLALVLAEFSSSGQPGFALGQAFRHREGSTVAWQWYFVRDPAWLELRLFTVRPSFDEQDAFLAHWDFLEMGRNGTLLGALCDEEAWREGLDRMAPRYPEGTADPETVGLDMGQGL